MSILTTLFKLSGACCILGVFAYGFLSIQQRMIYHPRSYNTAYDNSLKKVVQIEYETGQGKQISFFYKGQSIMPPKRLWIMFGGNGSLALDWFDRFLDHYSDGSSAYFLIEYPGYGKCEGNASPSSIAQSADNALETLFKRYESIQMASKTQLNAIGHSLGSAIALDFASRHPCQKIILLAPFTSLADMAKRVVGIPFCYLLTHHLDNHDRLLEIAQKTPQCKVYLFHGTNDAIIPVNMGKQLADSFPSLIRFIELPLTDHQTIITRGRNKIFQAMDGERVR